MVAIVDMIFNLQRYKILGAFARLLLEIFKNGAK